MQKKKKKFANLDVFKQIEVSASLSEASCFIFALVNIFSFGEDRLGESCESLLESYIFYSHNFYEARLFARHPYLEPSYC